MITLNANQATRSSEALRSLNDKYKFKLSLAMILAKNQRKLEEMEEQVTKRRQKILEEFGVPSETRPGAFDIPPENLVEFQKQINALTNETVELDLTKVKVDKLFPDEQEVEPSLLVPLDWMFS